MLAYLTENWTFVLVLWLFGIAGGITFLPLLPKLATVVDKPVPMPMWQLQLLTLVQLSVVLAVLAALGSWWAMHAGLQAPYLSAVLGQSALPESHLVPLLLATAVGVFSSIMVMLLYKWHKPHLSAEFLEKFEPFKMPWFTRLGYGGFTEEVMIRWGLLSGLAFVGTVLVPDQPFVVFLIANLISTVLFAAGHLPLAKIFAGELNGALIRFVLLANSLFGFLAGMLFIAYGLEIAILAHVVFHLTALAVEKRQQTNHG